MSNQEEADQIATAIEARGARTVYAVGERVARVETKIEGLERDTSVIRTTLHAMAGQLQRAEIHESRCAQALVQISEQTKNLPDLVTKMTAFEELKPKIATVIEESRERKAAWRATILNWTAIGAVLTLLLTSGGLVVAFFAKGHLL